MGIQERSLQLAAYKVIQGIKRAHIYADSHENSSVNGDFNYPESKTAKLIKFWQKTEQIFPPAKYFADRIMIPPGLEALGTDNIEFVNGGNEHDVYKLKTEDQNWALKINYRINFSVNPAEKIEPLVNRYKKIKDFYSDIPAWIPEEYFAFIPGFKIFPRFDFKNNSNKSVVESGSKRGALAIFQPYLEGTLRDVFKDVKREELAELLVENPELGREFLIFSGITMAMYRQMGECISLNGRGNLILYRKDNIPQIIYLEPHSLNTQSNLSRKPVQKSRLEDCLKYLADVKEMVC